MFDDLTLYSAEARMKYDELAGRARTYRYIPTTGKTRYRKRFSLRSWLKDTLGRALHGTEMGCGYRV